MERGAGWQGTPRSDELGGKYGLESRGSVFPVHQVRSSRQHINSPNICKCGIIPFLKRVVFLA